MNQNEDRPSVEELWQEVRASGQDAVRDLYHVAYRTVTSRRVHTTVIGTALLAIAAALLYIPAVFLYIAMYYKIIPDQVVSVPVHLQYGYGAHPFGIALLEPPKRIHHRLPYDISVTLTLPRSPPNLDRGNFMVVLHLLSPPDSSAASADGHSYQPQQILPYTPPSPHPPPSADDDYPPPPPRAASASASASAYHYYYRSSAPDLAAFLAPRTILHTAARPAILPYADPAVSAASRWLFLLYHLLFPRAAASARLTVPLAEGLVFAPPPQQQQRWRRGSSQQQLQQPLPPPAGVLLELQAGNQFQVYEASVTFVVELRGLRWFMYRWWGTAFVVFTAGFWAVEVVSMLGAMLVLGWWFGFGGGGGGGGGEVVKEEEEKVTSEAGWTTSESKLESGLEKGVKKEEEEEEERGMAGMPDFGAGQGAEADDEAEERERKRKWKGKGKAREEGPRWEDRGEGTSYSSQVSGEGARRRYSSGRRASR
ncbi:hypothetical protein VTK56DRAFT_7347 [Thermocarpiscus australiensis]